MTDSAHLTVTLKGADRRPLRDHARIVVRGSLDRTWRTSAVLEPPNYQAVFEKLIGDRYLVRAHPAKHRTVARFARAGQQITLHCPVKPEAVQTISPASDDILNKLELDPAHLKTQERASLMNIWAKMAATLLDTRQVTDFVLRVVRVESDRIWFDPLPDLVEKVHAAASGRQSSENDPFTRVSGVLHRMDGYQVIESFKTLDNYANLQLTFLRHITSGRLIVDADIDEARGVRHVFDVVGNALFSRSTNPYDIHQLLVFHQELDPGYKLVL